MRSHTSYSSNLERKILKTVEHWSQFVKDSPGSCSTITLDQILEISSLHINNTTLVMPGNDSCDNLSDLVSVISPDHNFSYNTILTRLRS